MNSRRNDNTMLSQKQHKAAWMYVQTLFSRSVICAVASDTLHLGLFLCFTLWSRESPLCLAPDAHQLFAPGVGGGGGVRGEMKIKCYVWTCVGFAAPLERLHRKKKSAEEEGGAGGTLNWLEPVSPWASRGAPIYQSEFQIRARGAATHPVRFISILLPPVCRSAAATWKRQLLATSRRF